MTNVASSPSRRTSGVPRALAVGTALTLLTLGACSDAEPRAATGDVAEDAPAGATTAAPSAPSQSPGDAASSPGDATPEPSAEAETPVAAPPLGRRTDRRSERLEPRLLSAADLPPLSPRTQWRGDGVSTSEQEDFALCHPFSLTAIGADEVRVRSFVDRGQERSTDAPATARARHLLAAFPDARTTRRARAVLRAWQSDCEQRLAEDMARVRVGEPVTVEGLEGPASWFRTRVRSRPRSVPVVEVTGTVRVGPRVAVVVLRDRKDGPEPAVRKSQIVAALERASAALG